MKRKRFLKNTCGVSSMYDAVLFIVMVSLSGVVLLPALQSNIAVDTSIEKHREHVADETLNAFLVSRVDCFSYKVCGDIIDGTADSVGINSSTNELYRSITNWLIGREQIHKTYGSLISEDLACQFRMPFSILGSKRINIFTGDYDRQLENKIVDFLSSYLGDKYSFNLSAKWHPIKGVDFGGESFIGDTPPDVDCHVARSFITMPYSPKINVPGVGEIVFSRYWFEDFMVGIPELDNIDDLVTGYDPLFTELELDGWKNNLSSNLSAMAEGFLLDGLQDDMGSMLFSGVLNLTLRYGFGKIRNMVESLTGDNITDALGESLGMTDSFFDGFTDEDNPLVVDITEELTKAVDPGSLLTDALDELENQTCNFVINLVRDMLNPYIESFIVDVLQEIDAGVFDLESVVFDWLFERVSLTRAEVTLTVWEARG